MAARISRLATQLDAAVAAATNPIERRCREAERAALWARQGKLSQAQAVVDALRSEAAFQPMPLPDAWLAWADGVLAYYGDLGREAGVQLQAAHQLALDLAAKRPAARELAGLTAAWLALHTFSRHDPPHMAALIRRAFELSEVHHHAVRARASLAAAFAYHLAGQADQAQPWNDLSRRHAVADGDEAHLSALMFNQASARANQARLVHLFAQDNEQALARDIAQALMVAESVDRFDDGIGTAALRSLVPMLQARMLTAQGRWEDALAVFDARLEQALREGMGYEAPSLHADAAWCAWNLRREERCQAALAASQASLQASVDPDDQAMALARLAQVRHAMGHTAEADVLRQQARAALQTHSAHQQALIAALDGALADVAPALFKTRC
jgi:hypothetical protein